MSASETVIREAVIQVAQGKAEAIRFVNESAEKYVTQVIVVD